MAFLRGRGTQMRVGGAWSGPGLLPTRLQYSSSWLAALLFAPLPPPLLVRRYDVVLPELHSREDSGTFSALMGFDGSGEAAGT